MASEKTDFLSLWLNVIAQIIDNSQVQMEFWYPHHFKEKHRYAIQESWVASDLQMATYILTGLILALYLLKKVRLFFLTAIPIKDVLSVLLTLMKVIYLVKYEMTFH